MNGTILNLGPLEVLVVIILALLVLGPERLPGIMRGIGTGLRKLRETYVAFVSEFRNELQPIAEEVDTVTREIQGELAAIREAADIRSVLNPVAQDLTDAANLKAPSSQPPVNAPAWGIGTEPTADGGRQTADDGRQTADGGRRTADDGRQTTDGTELSPPNLTIALRVTTLAAIANLHNLATMHVVQLRTWKQGASVL
jgi:sec-independent protein translocase protein TatB